MTMRKDMDMDIHFEIRNPKSGKNIISLFLFIYFKCRFSFFVCFISSIKKRNQPNRKRTSTIVGHFFFNVLFCVFSLTFFFKIKGGLGGGFFMFELRLF